MNVFSIFFWIILFVVNCLCIKFTSLLININTNVKGELLKIHFIGIDNLNTKHINQLLNFYLF